MAMQNLTADNIEAAISFSLSESECEGLQLKPEQQKALRSVLNKNDTTVVLPTGFGKSVVYMLLPFSFKYLNRLSRRSADKQVSSMVLVIEPLSSLMDDQIRELPS